MRRIAAFGIALGLVLGAVHGHAQDDVDETEQRAFAQGLERFRAGDTRAAIDIWSRLLETLGPERGWRVTYNLGRAYEESGDPTRAVEHFRAFLDVAKQQSGARAKESASAVKDAEQRLARIEKSYGVLEIGAPASGLVMVRVGIAEPRPAGFSLYLKPGQHRVTFDPGSDHERVETVTVVAGARVTLAAGTKALPARVVAPAKTHDAKATPDARFPTTWVVIGASATVVTSGVSFFLFRRADEKRDDASALGTRDAGYPAAKDDYDSARRLFQVSLIAPVVFGAATITLIAVHLGQSGSSRAQVGFGARGASVTGTFE